MLVSSEEHYTSDVAGALGFDAEMKVHLHPESERGQRREGNAGEEDEVKRPAGDRRVVRFGKGERGAYLTHRIGMTVNLDLTGQGGKRDGAFMNVGAATGGTLDHQLASTPEQRAQI
jgi:hypothetical protein